jgi:hypothetical protein
MHGDNIILIGYNKIKINATPRGGFGHPIPAVWGGRSHPLAKKRVVRPPYFWAKGWLQPPPISPLFFFFNFFFKKKKKKKLKSEMGQNYAVLGKTALFWASPKRRSFGVKGIMGRFLQKGPK